MLSRQTIYGQPCFQALTRSCLASGRSVKAQVQMTPPISSGAHEERLRRLFQTPMTLILGSASYSRKAILQELATQYGFSFNTVTADIDERAIGDRSASASPEELVLKLARAKQDAILRKLEPPQPGSPAFLITCDQVVVHDGNILEKPDDAAEARAFIAGYSSAPAATVGSVIVRNVGTGRQVEAVDTARIHFEPIPSDVIEQLIREGTVFKCAGALMIEHPLVEPLITRIDGTPDSVMGLPKHLVLKGLLEVSGA